MDIRALLTFVANHVEQIFGTTLVLFFLTCLLLLIRSIGSKKEDSAHGTVTATIDAQSVEDAVRRALSSHAPLIAAGAPAPSGGVISVPEGATPETLTAAVRERDARIEQLSRELEQLRSQVANAMEGPAAGVIGVSDSELAEMRAKLDEMQARLAEYEIIEDDIADLSMFKEENARLKVEIEELRAKLANVGPASIVQSAPEPIPTSSLSDLATKSEDTAPAAPVEEPAAAAEVAAPVTETPEDDVMREFAAALQVQKAPPAVASSSIPLDAQALAGMPAGAPPALEIVAEDPQAAVDAILAEAEAKAAATEPASSVDDLLGGETDPEKMLSEVASLEASEATAVEGAPSALEESLDTDKLLAEVGSLSGGASGGNDSAAAVAAAQTEETLNGDDLLSEFTSQSSKN